MTRAETHRKYRNSAKGKAWTLAYRLANAERLKAGAHTRYMRRKYGTDGVELLAAQKERCAICKTDLAAGEIKHLDHCHASGKVRGWLCLACNTGLGFFKDDTARLSAAVRYLRRAS